MGAIYKLDELTKASRRQVIVSGSPYWKSGLGRAQLAGLCLYDMYTNLRGRKVRRLLFNGLC
eukprot:gene30052-39244_t